MAITGIDMVGSLMNGVQQTTVASKSAGAVDFGQYLADALSEVNSLQNTAAQLNSDFVAGTNENIHQVLIAGEEASISLQLVMEVRNKVLEAYQEIMRMNI